MPLRDAPGSHVNTTSVQDLPDGWERRITCSGTYYRASDGPMSLYADIRGIELGQDITLTPDEAIALADRLVHAATLTRSLRAPIQGP